jgi:hypothetical protein
MGVSVRGHTDPRLHSPCPRCGYATRFKQWPTKCARSDAGRQKATSTPPYVIEIWAEQEALDAAREWPAGPALRVAPRYAAGRPRLARHT